MTRILLAALLMSGSAVSSAIPLSEWNLNLSAIGGADATHIGTVTLNGFSELDQTIAGNSAFGQAFAYSGSLQWVQYQQNGAFNPLGFGLPSGYTDLFLRFTGLSGTLDNSGNASFNLGMGAATLYLDSGGTLIPSVNALTLASYTLSGPSTASDIAYYDGFGISPMFNLSFQLLSATAGLFTDSTGAPILPQSIFTVAIDGLLDRTILANPTLVPGGTGTSINTLINAGEVSAVNVAQTTGTPPIPVPEPATAVLIIAGLLGISMVSRKAVF